MALTTDSRIYTEEIDEDIESMHEELEEAGADLDYEVPRFGKFYVFRVRLNNKYRYIISPLNASNTFAYRTRSVMTKFGLAEGASAAMQLKLIGFTNDYKTGETVGVYQVLACDAFVKASAKSQEIRDKLDQQLIYNQLVGIEYNTAARLRELLRVKEQEIETLQKTLNDIKIDIPMAASEMAEGILTFERLAMESAKRGLSTLSGNSIINTIKQNWMGVIVMLGILALALWAFFPIK